MGGGCIHRHIISCPLLYSTLYLAAKGTDSSHHFLAGGAAAAGDGEPGGDPLPFKLSCDDCENKQNKRYEGRRRLRTLIALPRP